VAGGLGGCGQQRVYDRQVLARETFTVDSPYAVMDTPAVAAARADRQMLGQGPGWWTQRHNDRLSLREGPQPGEIVIYEVEVYDRQYSTDEHIHDSYRERTRSYRTGQYVR